LPTKLISYCINNAGNSKASQAQGVLASPSELTAIEPRPRRSAVTPEGFQRRKIGEKYLFC
jgi:hypothetical protein